MLSAILQNGSQFQNTSWKPQYIILFLILRKIYFFTSLIYFYISSSCLVNEMYAVKVGKIPIWSTQIILDHEIFRLNYIGNFTLFLPKVKKIC